MAWRDSLRTLAGARKAARRGAFVRPRLEALEDRLTPSSWIALTSGTTNTLASVWGSGPNDVFAVGGDFAGQSTILHSADDGASWQPQTSGTTDTLRGVWGSGPNDVFAVGDTTITHTSNHGASWQAQSSPFGTVLIDIWGSGPGDIFAVGLGGAIVHSADDGASWQLLHSSGPSLGRVWGSGPTDVFAVGAGGTILHSSDHGASWQAQDSGATNNLFGVWGSGPNDVFAVGLSGLILHSTNDGASWQFQTSGTTQTLAGVWGSGPNDVFAVGGLLHSANDGASWQFQSSPVSNGLYSVWGSGPADVFVVGVNGVILHNPPPPTVNGPGPRTNNEGDAGVSLTITASNADPDSFSATGLPTGLSISSTGAISGTIDPRAAGTYSVTVTATEGGVPGSTTFTWTVNDTTRPVIDNPGDQTNNEGDGGTAAMTATDADPNSFSATGLPPGLTISTAGVISGTIDPRGEGIYHVTLSAMDGAVVGTTSFTWTVDDTTPPAIANPGDQTNNEGDALDATINAVDADANFFSATGLPTGLSLSPAGVITGTIDPRGEGVYHVTLSATDGLVVGETTFTWTVNDSTPPTILSLGAKTSNEGVVVAPFTVAAVDADANSFSALGLPTGLSISTSGVISGTIGAKAAGVYTVTVSATDGAVSGSTTFTWTVKHVVPPTEHDPVFALFADHSLSEHTAAGWQLLSPAGTILSISAVTDGAGFDDVYAITADSHLWEHTPAGWAFLSAGAFQQLSAATNSNGDAVVFAVLTDNSLWENSLLFVGGWKNLSSAGSILSISAITDASGADDVYAITADSHLWEHTPTSWVFLSPGGFQSISAGLNGVGQAVVYAVLKDASLWENNPAFSGAWQNLSSAGSILAASAAAPDQVFAITSDHHLWQHKLSGWSLISTGSFASISGENNGGASEVFAVLSDASLWEYSTGWAMLDAGVLFASAPRRG